MTTEKFLELIKDEDFKELFQKMDENRKAIDNTVTLAEFLRGQKRVILSLASDYKNKLLEYIKVIVDVDANKDTRSLALMGLSDRKNVYSMAEFVDSEIYNNLIEVADVYDAVCVPA